MSVMGICEAIGIELQNTEEGIGALKKYSSLLGGLNEDDKYLFLQSSNKVQWGLHFYITEAVVDLLKANIENEYLGSEVQRILLNKYIDVCIKPMHSLGDFISSISMSVFQNNVQYSLPSEVRATPKLIRLIQDLSVECQKTRVLQELVPKFQSGSNFQKLLTEFDLLHKDIIAPPYSKSDRVIVKRLSLLGYSKNDVELVLLEDTLIRSKSSLLDMNISNCRYV
ncbi:hypothetical protein LGK97_19570 [Clostridium sp. CS001]|uniref:hypothetical protein n=1 Tax=Clostridium sp. CS001 TaxID=2880648 RepID=UPI001CF431EC|nr:hypothetical protein [Clostridium sp. CS001]MCB2291899.1 hypothetical protein [Clostridium sp. CS001]